MEATLLWFTYGNLREPYFMCLIFCTIALTNSAQIALGRKQIRTTRGYYKLAYNNYL